MTVVIFLIAVDVVEKTVDVPIALTVKHVIAALSMMGILLTKIVKIPTIMNGN